MEQIQLNGMKFYAYHGCLVEEQNQGNHFLVDAILEYNMEKAAASDSLNNALNYAEAYKLIKNEMDTRSCLLEHLTQRILKRLFKHFPQLERAKVCVSKLKPPIGGEMQSVSVNMQRSRHQM
jgi:dihydroneopterin aldolase